MIVKDIGLNIGINTLGLWTDSSKAHWQILEKGGDYFKIKVIFWNLPLSQIWSMNIKDGQEIGWTVDSEIEEWLHIDEFRIISLIDTRYKSWISNYQQRDFPRLDNNWHDLYAEDLPATLVGVRFPVEEEFLPSFVLEIQDNNLFALIQSPPLEVNSYIVGFRRIIPEEKKDYPQGFYRLFSGKINLFRNDYLLDTKIEKLRQAALKREFKEKKIQCSKKNLKVLLVNLPWHKDGKWGVRAGSRWPHIKDESEGNYLPFPFFLAHATSLLQKHDISATLIDAIAEQLPEDVFIQRILAMDFDILLAETSTPSFYDDLNMLKKISSFGIPIILCGPHVEIYQPQFLREHTYIDFVLYGEYEFSLLELIQKLKKNNKDLSVVNGLLWRSKTGVTKNPPRDHFDINFLPWPERHGVPIEKYWDLPGNIPYPSVQMLASRGCPFRCHFCLWPHVMYQGNSYRTRDVENVIDEMEYCIREMGFKSVYFDDDTFNVGTKRMLTFCRAIKERSLQNNPWAIMARADLMDEEVLTQMKSAGLSAVKYGVESCNQSLVRNCRKKMDLDKTTSMIKITKSLGIKVHLTFCFGIDGETKETIQATTEYALSLNPDSVQFSILTPFPGTRLFEELDNQGRILTKDWTEYDGHHACVFKPLHLSVQDLEVAKRRAYHIWADHKRKKRGLRGDAQRFRQYLKEYGFKNTLNKTADYLHFICFKRRRYLSGNC